MNEIPKIQWKNITIIGTATLGSNIITALASVVGLEVGMLIDNPNFPEGTVIDVIGGGTATMSNNATASSTEAMNFYFEFVFTYPPIKDAGDEIKPVGTKRIAFSGATQFNLKHLELRRSLKFDFLDKIEIDTLRNFYKTHASALNEFLYFEDIDLPGFVTVELQEGSFKPKKSTQTLSTLTIKTRRVE